MKSKIFQTAKVLGHILVTIGIVIFLYSVVVTIPNSNNTLELNPAICAPFWICVVTWFMSPVIVQTANSDNTIPGFTGVLGNDGNKIFFGKVVPVILDIIFVSLFLFGSWTKIK